MSINDMDLETVEFWVAATWDDEYKVYYSESNIPGLNIEASTLGEFEDVMFDIAPELIFENVIKPALADTDNSETIEARTPKPAMSVREIPESGPFSWRGATPRNMQLSMA